MNSTDHFSFSGETGWAQEKWQTAKWPKGAYSSESRAGCVIAGIPVRSLVLPLYHSTLSIRILAVFTLRSLRLVIFGCSNYSVQQPAGPPTLTLTCSPIFVVR